MTLKVFDIRSRFVREVVLVPSRAWNGYGVLGLTLRLESLVNERHDPSFAYDDIYQNEDATASVNGGESFFPTYPRKYPNKQYSNNNFNQIPNQNYYGQSY